MAERVKKRSEIREQDTWKLEDMIASPEKFEELADGVEERIPGYETYRGKLGSSADLLKSYLEFDESMDETISLLYAYAMQKRDQDTSVSENQALVSRVQSLAAAYAFREGGSDLSVRFRDRAYSVIGILLI